MRAGCVSEQDANRAEGRESSGRTRTSSVPTMDEGFVAERHVSRETDASLPGLVNQGAWPSGQIGRTRVELKDADKQRPYYGRGFCCRKTCFARNRCKSARFGKSRRMAFRSDRKDASRAEGRGQAASLLWTRVLLQKDMFRAKQMQVCPVW